MVNVLYLETFSSSEDYEKTGNLCFNIKSFTAYCVFRACLPEKLLLRFVTTKPQLNYNSSDSVMFSYCTEEPRFIATEDIPWQVKSCVYPVVMYEDTIITGLCAVARHICKFRSLPNYPQESSDGLLSFRQCCLQAPNEASIWTKFCEVDIINTVKYVLAADKIDEVPGNMVRFENHLNKPIRLHNAYKIARELNLGKLRLSEESENLSQSNVNSNKLENDNDKQQPISRLPKPRKWKSNKNDSKRTDTPNKKEDLDNLHQFAEGPFLTLADLILLPSYHILQQVLGDVAIKNLLPLTVNWYKRVIEIPELNNIINKMECHISKCSENIRLPLVDDVSLYKCDPKRHNPKKRLFTKEDDIENALSVLDDGMVLNVINNPYWTNDITINWDDIPKEVNPLGGHLPDKRMDRKSEQLENLVRAVLSLTKKDSLIVDFCSGSGHLGILIAYLLPLSTVILLENKEQSLLRARERVHSINLKNVFFFQCNLDFFIGKFDIGVALHACGIATDLVLDKCLKAQAKFVICPCCYGFIHATDRLEYPRSNMFSCLNMDQYLCIGHAADQTHEEHRLTARGDKCMAVIDSDRGRLAQQNGYNVWLTRLKPLTCTPKNNLLVGELTS